MDHRAAIETIAKLTFPGRDLGRVSVRCAYHVERRREESITDDWLVDLANIEEAGPNVGMTRQTVPLSSGIPIPQLQGAQITTRTEQKFRCERFMIANAGTGNNAADWIVNNVIIGGRSQFAQQSDIPGDMFASNAIDTFVAFETAMPSTDIIVVVTYIGPDVKGRPFFATMVGTAGMDMPQYVRVGPTARADVTLRMEMALRQLRTMIHPGFAYVSRGDDGDVTITVCPINAELQGVAVDAALTHRVRVPAVDAVISQAMEGRGARTQGIVHDTYVAFVMQRAEEMLAEESRSV